jgi:hypothetical protein
LPLSHPLVALAAAFALAIPSSPGAAPHSPAADGPHRAPPGQAAEAPHGTPPLGPVLARTFRLYGGVEAILAVGALRLTGKVVDGVAAPGAVPHFERLLALPDRYRSSVTLGGLERETLILYGNRAFRDGAEVTGLARADLIRLEAARTFLPAELARRRASLVDRGEARRQGHLVRIVELPLSEHASLTAEIDPASGTILRSVARANGREAVVSFRSLRPVGGVLFPFAEELEALGRKQTLVIEQVDLLPADSVRISQP